MIHARRLSASLGSQLLHEVLLPNDHLGALGNAVPGITEFEHADILARDVLLISYRHFHRRQRSTISLMLSRCW
jgi:hypothetical protein